MDKIIKDKKIFYRLILLAVITTPLFGLLGGTPFLTFDYKKLNHFLPGIYFVAIITLLFWIINISLLLATGKNGFINKIFVRSFISIAIGFGLSTIIFYSFRLNNPRPPFRIQAERMAKDLNDHRPVVHIKMDGPDTNIAYAPVMDISAPGEGLTTADPNFKTGIRGSFIRQPFHFFFFPEIVRALTINLIILTLCELVFLYSRKQKVETENAKLKQSNLEAKNNQLKMQLHPHFLFNSLNTLRLLLKKDAVKAEDYLLKLSEMLRFSTTSALHDLVDVEDELKLCLSYLEMQKVRFGEMLHFSITNPQLYTLKGKLPVYSLQLLAENAIKHNSFTNEQPLTIFIDYDALTEMITVRNKIQPKRIKEVTTKIGLKNLDERYRLLSNESIRVANDENEFTVNIKVLPANQNTV